MLRRVWSVPFALVGRGLLVVGLGLGAPSCERSPPVTLRQWRTLQHLDGAFEDLATDPQVVELPGEVTRLPERYRGHRLGHNWSISWVVDHLAGGAPP